MLTLYIHYMLTVTVVIKHFVTYFGLQAPCIRTYTELNVPEKIAIKSSFSRYNSSLYL